MVRLPVDCLVVSVGLMTMARETYLCIFMSAAPEEVDNNRTRGHARTTTKLPMAGTAFEGGQAAR